MTGTKKKQALWKRVLSTLGFLILFPPLVVVFLPLIYLAFLALAIVVPPFAYLHLLHEKWQARTPFSVREELLRFGSYLVLFPLAVFAIVAVLRSITLFVFSLYSPALVLFQTFHYDMFYHLFIPYFGDHFPYWLDLYWGAGAVVVLFIMSIYDSWKRSVLVRQIKLLPTSKIYAAAIGLVELKGKAVQFEPNNKEPIMRSWTDMTDDGMSFRSFAQPFYLDDGTGRVLIDPRGCEVNQADSIFSINIHQAVLQQERGANGLLEGRLMPGESVYVLGDLQVNNDPDNPDDKVVIKPGKSTLFHPKFHDVFFVSDEKKDVLLEAFHRISRRGWLNSFIILCITGWMSVYAWTNIMQVSFNQLEAAPAVFRLLTPATDMEREISVGKLGPRPVISWIDEIEAESPLTDDIMYELREQQLAQLATPVLTRQAIDIDSSGFVSANYWLQKLKRYPPGMWGQQFFKEEYVQKNISRKGNNEAFVYRVILHYDEPVLTATWKAWFSKFESKRLTLVEKNVVFSLTNTQTGEVYLRQIPLAAGWNEGKNDLLFQSIPRGNYELYAHVRRDYRGGRHDKGSRNGGKFEINLM